MPAPTVIPLSPSLIHTHHPRHPGAAAAQVACSLDRLVEPLGATLQAKVKGDAVKQEVDRNEDMLRSCLRAVDALAKLPNAMQVVWVCVCCEYSECRECTASGGGEMGPSDAVGMGVVVAPRVRWPPAGDGCTAAAAATHTPLVPPLPLPQVAPFKQFMEQVVMGPTLKVGTTTGGCTSCPILMQYLDAILPTAPPHDPPSIAEPLGCVCCCWLCGAAAIPQDKYAAIREERREGEGSGNGLTSPLAPGAADAMDTA